MNTKQFSEKHPRISSALDIIGGILMMYTLYFVWINTPPYDSDYKGIRFYYWVGDCED